MGIPQGRGLGRKYAPDPRDRKYLMAAHPKVSEIVTTARKRWSYRHKALDQGDTGTCVGHAWKHYLMAAPIEHRFQEAPSAFEIYDIATKLDEWPENDNDTARQFGTSVRAGAKAVQSKGLLKEYRWLYTADEIETFICGQNAEGKHIGGPVVIGVPWYTGMFQINTAGFVNISGIIEGGHSVLILGADPVSHNFDLINQWADWGLDNRGDFRMTRDTLDRLMQQDGEACAAIEMRGVHPTS